MRRLWWACIVLGAWGASARGAAPASETVGSTAPAGAPPNAGPLGPIAFLQAHDAKVQNLLKQNPTDPLPPAIRQDLKRQINAVFDFRELSRLALGTYWDRRSEAERATFVRTFTDIIEQKNFDSFLRYYREGKFNYQKEEVTGAKATVKAMVPLKQEQISILYLMHQVGGQWRVYDLVIDDVSTADGYQRQYSRYIEKYSYEKLLEQLKKQLDRLRGKS